MVLFTTTDSPVFVKEAASFRKDVLSFFVDRQRGRCGMEGKSQEARGKGRLIPWRSRQEVSRFYQIRVKFFRLGGHVIPLTASGQKLDLTLTSVPKLQQRDGRAI